MGNIDYQKVKKKLTRTWNNYFLRYLAFIDWDPLLNAWNPDNQHDSVKWLQKALSSKIQDHVFMQYPERMYPFTFSGNSGEWHDWVGIKN